MCKELGLDDDARRAITKRLCDRWSTKNLTKPQMARLIGELYRLLGQEVRNDYIDTVPGGATVAQVKKIRALAAVRGRGTNPKWLETFLRKMTCQGLGLVDRDGGRMPRDLTDGKGSCEQLTKKEASDVIEALKNWIEREGRGGVSSRSV